MLGKHFFRVGIMAYGRMQASDPDVENIMVIVLENELDRSSCYVLAQKQYQPEIALW